MPSVIKSQVIEVILPNGSTATKIQLQDQPYLRGKSIIGFETYSVNDVSVSPSGKPVMPYSVLLKSFFTFYLNDLQNPQNVGEWIQNVPMASLHRTQNNANEPFVRKSFDMVGQVVYWEKCYITIGTSVSPALGADTSFLFNVYFK